MKSRQGPERLLLFALGRGSQAQAHSLANMCVTMDWSQFKYTHYGRTVGSLTICGQQPITKMSWAWAASHGTLWAGLVLVLLLLLVCSPCSLRCRQFQFEILRSTRVGSKKWESLKIFTASQGRLWEFYVTFYGADVIVSRCCWHSSAGFRRQRLTQFVWRWDTAP